MRGRSVFAAVVIAGVTALLQSTLLSFATIADVMPDLVLIVAIFVANRNGPMVGQVAGLGAGIILDLLGLSPLGFYALIYAILGSAFGVTQGKVFVDAIFMPVLFVLVGLVAKGLLAIVLAGLFGIGGVSEVVLSSTYLIEVGYTAVVAPILFALLRLARVLGPDARRGERV